MTLDCYFFLIPGKSKNKNELPTIYNKKSTSEDRQNKEINLCADKS